MTDEIPIVLVSNASLSIYPENTVSHFKNKLPKAIELPNYQKWLVGLKEISFTFSWFTFASDQEVYIARQYVDIEKDETTQMAKSHKNRGLPTVLYIATVKPKRFQKINDIIEIINAALAINKSAAKLIVGSHDNTINITSEVATNRNGDSFFDLPLFSEELLMFLGLHLSYASLMLPLTQTEQSARITNVDIEDKIKDNRRSKLLPLIPPLSSYAIWSRFTPLGIALTRKSRASTSSRSIMNENFINVENFINYDRLPIKSIPIDLMNGCHTMLVYSDIIQPVIVGDKFASLLSMVDIPSNTRFGEQIHRRFENPHFVPICRHRIDSIEIAMRDDSGDPIRFEFGRVIMTIILKRDINSEKTEDLSEALLV